MSECLVCAQPIVDTAYVCHDDEQRLGARLRNSGELWPEMDVTVARQSRMGQPGPRPRGHAPASPIRPDGKKRHYDDQVIGHPGGLVVDLGASDTRDALINTVTTWARVIAEERGHTPPSTMPALLRWLAGQLGWVRHQPWAAEAWDELGDVERAIARVIDRPVELVDAGQCWADTDAGPCQRWLTARPGAAVITCPDCRTPHDTAARREWMLAQAGDMLGTPVELARWLSLPVGTVYSWVSRGRLIGSGGLYRVRDAQKLAAERERVAA